MVSTLRRDISKKRPLILRFKGFEKKQRPLFSSIMNKYRFMFTDHIHQDFLFLHFMREKEKQQYFKLQKNYNNLYRYITKETLKTVIKNLVINNEVIKENPSLQRLIEVRASILFKEKSYTVEKQVESLLIKELQSVHKLSEQKQKERIAYLSTLNERLEKSLEHFNEYRLDIKELLKSKSLQAKNFIKIEKELEVLEKHFSIKFETFKEIEKKIQVLSKKVDPSTKVNLETRLKNLVENKDLKQTETLEKELQVLYVQESEKHSLKLEKEMNTFFKIKKPSRTEIHDNEIQSLISQKSSGSNPQVLSQKIYKSFSQSFIRLYPNSSIKSLVQVDVKEKIIKLLEDKSLSKTRLNKELSLVKNFFMQELILEQEQNENTKEVSTFSIYQSALKEILRTEKVLGFSKRKVLQKAVNKIVYKTQNTFHSSFELLVAEVINEFKNEQNTFHHTKEVSLVKKIKSMYLKGFDTKELSINALHTLVKEKIVDETFLRHISSKQSIVVKEKISNLIKAKKSLETISKKEIETLKNELKKSGIKISSLTQDKEISASYKENLIKLSRNTAKQSLLEVIQKVYKVRIDTQKIDRFINKKQDLENIKIEEIEDLVQGFQSHQGRREKLFNTIYKDIMKNSQSFYKSVSFEQRKRLINVIEKTLDKYGSNTLVLEKEVSEIKKQFVHSRKLVKTDSSTLINQEKRLEAKYEARAKKKDKEEVQERKELLHFTNLIKEETSVFKSTQNKYELLMNHSSVFENKNLIQELKGSRLQPSVLKNINRANIILENLKLTKLTSNTKNVLNEDTKFVRQTHELISKSKAQKQENKLEQEEAELIYISAKESVQKKKSKLQIERKSNTQKVISTELKQKHLEVKQKVENVHLKLEENLDLLALKIFNEIKDEMKMEYKRL